MKKPRIDTPATIAVKEALNTHTLAETHIPKVLYSIGSALRKAQAEVEDMAARLERSELRNRELKSQCDGLRRKLKSIEPAGAKACDDDRVENRRKAREIRELEKLHVEAMAEKDQQIQRLRSRLERVGC